MKKKSILLLALVLVVVLLAAVLVACGTTDSSPLIVSVTFMDGDAEYHKTMFGLTFPIVMPDEPAKTGFVFGGWYYDKDSWQLPFDKDVFEDENTDEEVTLHAKWMADNTTISFNANGGAGEMQAQSIAYHGDKKLSANLFAKAGYEFAGWAISADGDVVYDNECDYVPTIHQEVTLFAIWQMCEYKVTFKDEDRSLVAERTYNVETSSITEPDVPEKVGYTGEWESYSLNETNQTVAPVYTIIDYKITFNDENGSFVEEVDYTVETDSITEPSVPNKTGYTGEWDTYSLNETNQIVEPIYTAIEYTITFNDENGNLVEEVDYTIETESITEPNVPEKVGYTGEWESYSLNETNQTVTPVYTIIEYTITFNDENGSLVEEIDYTVETDSITEPSIPNKTGYTGEWSSYSLNETNQIVEPVYTAIEYTITFNDENGNLVEAVDYTIETSSITEPDVPEKTGYTGVWSSYSLDETNQIVTPVYTIIEYTITFNDENGSLVEEIGYTVETDSITEPSVPSKTGYTGEWDTYSLNETNQVVEPIYTAIEYTITFNDENGNLVEAVDYTIETSSITEPDVPEKTGYTGEWESYSLNETNQTVEPVYTIIDYKITFNDENGSLVAEVVYTVETDSITEPSIPNKTGYTGEWSSYSLNETNQIVEPIYTAIEYTITFNDENGNLVEAVDYTIETSSITEPNVPEKTGYTGEWESYALDETNQTVEPVYTPIQYSITYNLDGGVNSTSAVTTFNIESADFSLPTPTKNGYAFEGWFANADFSGAKIVTLQNGSLGDKTYYAMWSIYRENGAVMTPEEMGSPLLKTAFYESNGLSLDNAIVLNSFDELQDLIDWTLFNYFDGTKYFKMAYKTFNSGDEIGDEIRCAVQYSSCAAWAHSYGYTKDLTVAYMKVRSDENYNLDLKNTVASEADANEAYRQQNSAVYTEYVSTRQDDYQFLYETRLHELSVSDSDQLYVAFQYGYKPVPVAGSKAEIALDKAESIMLDLVDDTMTDTEKLFEIYRWFSAETRYNNAALAYDISWYCYAWFAEGALNRGLAVCDGIAKAFCILAGIENITTVRVTSSGEGPHAWNKVFIDADNNGTNEWYCIDATWVDDAYSSGEEIMSFESFLFTDIEKEATGQVDDNFLQFDATTEFNQYDFYAIDDNYDLWVENYTELDAVMDFAVQNKDTSASKSKYLTIEFAVVYSVSGATADSQKQNIVQQIHMAVDWSSNFTYIFEQQTIDNQTVWIAKILFYQ